MISSVAPTRLSTFYAYLMTRIENRNLKSFESYWWSGGGIPNRRILSFCKIVYYDYYFIEA